jgi:hypothetical protein
VTLVPRFDPGSAKKLNPLGAEIHIDHDVRGEAIGTSISSAHYAA